LVPGSGLLPAPGDRPAILAGQRRVLRRLARRMAGRRAAIPAGGAEAPPPPRSVRVGSALPQAQKPAEKPLAISAQPRYNFLAHK